MDAAAWLKSVEDPNAQTEKRTRVQELAKLATAARTPEEIANETSLRAADVMGAEQALLFLVDAASNQLVLPLPLPGRPPIAEGPKDARLPLDLSSVAGFVALSKANINLRNVADPIELARINPKLRYDDRLEAVLGSKVRSLLTIPVLHEQTVLGVLQLRNRKDGAVFFPRDVVAAEEITRAVAAPLAALAKAKEAKAKGRVGKWDGLLDAGVITRDGLAKALAQATAAAMDPPRFLFEKAGLQRADVEKSLAQYYRCETYRFTGREQIPTELKGKVRGDFLKKMVALPVERRATELLVVIDDPSDIGRTDALRSLDPERELIYLVGLRDEILAAVDQLFAQRTPVGDVGSILKELSTDEGAGAVEETGDDESRGAETDSAVIKLANQIILDAFRKGASDIHIEPNGKEHSVSIRFRVDGDCIQYQDIPPSIRNSLVARIKIMAKLDISERRKPQDGKIRFRMQDRQIELRVATIPTVNGNEDVVMRILAASKPIPLADMGMSERNLAELRKLVAKPYGLMLVVGPTGSGKTTTLHSALGSINTPDMKIWTAEDPVEITQPGLRQVQVQAKIGFDFAAAMRAFLRADPDVIMVGEMRDKETAGMGVEASLTGHLVLSTLHTNSAPETITRLVDMGLDPFSFADALLGVLAQRLARSLCSRCKEQIPATVDEIATLTEALGEEDMKRRNWTPGTLKLWRGAGCDACGNSGYKGRVAIHELLVNNDDLKHAIARRAPVEELRNLAVTSGMTTLLVDGVEKAVAGRTDLKQVLAVCAR